MRKNKVVLIHDTSGPHLLKDLYEPFCNATQQETHSLKEDMMDDKDRLIQIPPELKQSHSTSFQFLIGHTSGHDLFTVCGIQATLPLITSAGCTLQIHKALIPGYV